MAVTARKQEGQDTDEDYEVGDRAERKKKTGLCEKRLLDSASEREGVLKNVHLPVTSETSRRQVGKESKRFC